MVEAKVYEHGYVKRIDVWGSDERVIEAARMSTGKGFQGWQTDMRLLAYLWRNRHTTPFEQCGLTIEIQAPLFVIRQWQRHRTQSYNELSGRYTAMEPLYYVPDESRVRSQDPLNKQGSASEPVSEEISREFIARIRADIEQIEATYRWALEHGISRELARINTPLSRYSRMRASANLLNWLRFIAIRSEEGAQEEIREYTHATSLIVESAFPRTHQLAGEKPI